jgi:hypothetical protein
VHPQQQQRLLFSHFWVPKLSTQISMGIWTNDPAHLICPKLQPWGGGGHIPKIRASDEIEVASGLTFWEMSALGTPELFTHPNKARGAIMKLEMPGSQGIRGRECLVLKDDGLQLSKDAKSMA